MASSHFPTCWGRRVSEADIDAAADFLCRLRELSQRPESAALPPAADACFSVAETLRYLRARLGRLQPEVRGQRPEVRCQTSDLGPVTSEFSAFMSDDFTPGMEAIVASATSPRYGRDGAAEIELPAEERGLSPSDFGFHNALLRGGQEWVFLDFEYFGWDDPAKTVSDFLLHPGMELTDVHKKRFVRGLQRRSSQARGLRNACDGCILYTA